MKPDPRLIEALKKSPLELRETYVDALLGVTPEQEAPPELFTATELLALAENETKPVIHSTGWKDLDRIAAGGIAEGEAVLLAAQAGAGKTHFAVNLALNYAERNLPVFYLTLEDGWKMVLDRFRAMGSQELLGNVVMMREDELTIQNALPTLKRAAEDCALIVVDNLFALPLRQGAKGDYWTSQAEWVDDLCNLIRSTTSSALILHHLNKDRNGGAAERWQVAGSTRIINRVAQAWLMIRSEQDPYMLAVKSEKNRRSPLRGECFLKSGERGLLHGVATDSINPSMAQYVHDTFRVER